jgi:hypothetical protein
VAAESASNAGDGAVTGTFSVSKKSRHRILLVARTHLREKPPIARGLFSKPWGTAQTQSNDNQFLVVSDYDLGCVHFFDMLLVNTEDEALINNTNLDGASGRSAVAAGGPGGHGASGAAEVEANDRGGRPSPPSKTSTFDVESGADNVNKKEMKST